MEWQPWQRRQFPGATARLRPPATAFPQWYTPFARQQREAEAEARATAPQLYRPGFWEELRQGHINMLAHRGQTAHAGLSAITNRLLTSSLGDWTFDRLGRNRMSDNYQHNRSIDIGELLAETNGFIDFQRDANDFRMGILESSWDMGCVWIATFNALHALGDTHHPADIIQRMETTGGFALQGHRGAFTQPAEVYMRYAGYNTRTNYLPRLQTIDNEIRNGDIAILTYARGDLSGHAVAIQYMGNGLFRVYNESTARDYISSIEDWIQSQLQREGRNSMAVVSSLTIINRP